MTVPVGGLRGRFIRDSLYYMLKDSLTSLGWFSPGRQHSPVAFPVDPLDPLEEVALNTLGLADGGLVSHDIELGSLLAEFWWTFYVDFFAESETIALHMIRDIADILAGRMGSIGRSTPTIVCSDYSQATPVDFAVLLIEDVAVERAEFTQKPWQKHWYSCSFRVIDQYANENG